MGEWQQNYHTIGECQLEAESMLCKGNTVISRTETGQTAALGLITLAPKAVRAEFSGSEATAPSKPWSGYYQPCQAWTWIREKYVSSPYIIASGRASVWTSMASYSSLDLHYMLLCRWFQCSIAVCARQSPNVGTGSTSPWSNAVMMTTSCPRKTDLLLWLWLYLSGLSSVDLSQC